MFETTPKIMKETCDGLVCYDIQDAMLAHREIQCVGEINDTSVNSLINQLMYLQHQDTEAEIKMYINSPGGSVDAGMALYDVMQNISCPITTICVGLAASMGAVLFCSGKTRQMLPHSRVMIHDPLIPSTGGNALRLRSISDDLMETREIIAQIMAEHTGRTLEEIYECTAKDTFFRAEDAVKFGLADSVLRSI